jgi:hypothetical protein
MAAAVETFRLSMSGEMGIRANWSQCYIMHLFHLSVRTIKPYNKIMETLYKYFDCEAHMRAFINGEVYFNSLSYFISTEDESRRDKGENLNVYEPDGGLKITKTTGGKIILPASLISRVSNPQNYYIFCVSKVRNRKLYKDFNAAEIVKIHNLVEFRKRMKRAIVRLRQKCIIKNDTLLDGPVEYYSVEGLPGTRYACPDEIIMAKLNLFEYQKEYRFAFAKRKNAFVVDNVDYGIENKKLYREYPISNQVLNLGDLSDISERVTL